MLMKTMFWFNVLADLLFIMMLKLFESSKDIVEMVILCSNAIVKVKLCNIQYKHALVCDSWGLFVLGNNPSSSFLEH